MSNIHYKRYKYGNQENHLGNYNVDIYNKSYYRSIILISRF